MPMLDELRHAVRRRRGQRDVQALVRGFGQLLSEQAEMDGTPVALDVIERLQDLDDAPMDAVFEHLARDLGPDPATVLQRAQAYAEAPDPARLIALTRAVEPPRQELLRRINRVPGGTAAVLRLRRALLPRLGQRPELAGIEYDLLHLLSSWFNPGFLQMRQVDWQSPAQLLEKVIRHEAVHQIDGWDDLRRRLQPDRRCFAFFHPQLPEEPLIFVEVALLPEMPAAIGPLIDKHATPLPSDRFRVAAFYSISNCEPGLRGVSLGNFLIKRVALRLKQELPQLRTFCTLSPIPRLAAWLRGGPDLSALPGLKRGEAEALSTAWSRLQATTGGDLAALQGAPLQDRLQPDDHAALLRLAAAYLVHASPSPEGDPVARFHLDNGARLERLNPRANLSPYGLKQSFGLMVNYLYDLPRVEAHHARFRAGEVVRSRAVEALRE